MPASTPELEAHFLEVLAQYGEQYGQGPIILGKKGSAPLPSAGRFSISVSKHSSWPGHCILYSRDICRIPRPLNDRVETLKTLLAQTFDNRRGILYTLAGGMPYACLPLHIETLTPMELEEAKKEMVSELDAWLDAMHAHVPGKFLPVHLGAETLTYLNECVSNLVGTPAQLEPVTKTIQLEASGLNFWVCPSYRGPGYGRIMAAVCPLPQQCEEWPLWHMLRRNEISEVNVGLTNGSVVTFRDIKVHEIPASAFPAWVTKFLTSTRSLQRALEHSQFELGTCLASGHGLTDTEYHMQYWYECVDCRIEKSIGLCLPCAYHCHGTHQLRLQPPVSFFCDCPVSGCCQLNAVSVQQNDLQLLNALDMDEVSDVTLVFSDGVSVQCHKVIIARSPWLAGLLACNVCNDLQPERPVIHTSDLPGETGKLVVRWLYGDRAAFSTMEESQQHQLLKLLSADEELLTLDQWLARLVNNPQFSDVTLTCGDQQFTGHRVLLCARSEYWLRLFSSGMQEAGDKELPISDGSAPPSVALSLLKYIYTGQVEEVDVGDTLSLFCLAKELVLEELAYRCEVLLCRAIDASCAAEVHAIATQYSSHTIAGVCVDRLSQELAEDPSCPHRELVFDAWCHSCLGMLLKGDFEGVVALAGKAHELCPTASRALALQGIAHMCLGEMVSAGQQLAKALDPNLEPHRESRMYSSIYAFMNNDATTALGLLALAAGGENPSEVVDSKLHTVLQSLALSTDPAGDAIDDVSPHRLDAPPISHDHDGDQCAADHTSEEPGITDASAPQESKARMGTVPIDLPSQSEATVMLQNVTDPITCFLRAAYTADMKAVGHGVWNCPLLTLCQGVALERGGLHDKARASYTLAMSLTAPLPFPLAHSSHSRVA